MAMVWLTMDNQQSEMIITWSPPALLNGYSCILLGDRLRDMRTVPTIPNVTVACYCLVRVDRPLYWVVVVIMVLSDRIVEL